MRAALALVLVALGPCASFAAEAPAAPAPASNTQSKWWDGSFSAYWYSLPHEDDFVMPIVTLRRDRLHLEARYNYEDRDTTSLFAGWVFETDPVAHSVSKSAFFEIVPMLGAVTGRTDGAAPAFKLTFEWKRLDVYSENEYLIDFSDHDLNFFYDWTEVTLRAPGWLATGIVVQRTRTVDTGLDVQRGLMARFGHAIGAVVYWFNPGSDDHFAVLAVGAEF